MKNGRQPSKTSLRIHLDLSRVNNDRRLPSTIASGSHQSKCRTISHFICCSSIPQWQNSILVHFLLLLQLVRETLLCLETINGSSVYWLLDERVLQSTAADLLLRHIISRSYTLNWFAIHRSDIRFHYSVSKKCSYFHSIRHG